MRLALILPIIRWSWFCYTFDLFFAHLIMIMPSWLYYSRLCILTAFLLLHDLLRLIFFIFFFLLGLHMRQLLGIQNMLERGSSWKLYADLFIIHIFALYLIILFLVLAITILCGHANLLFDRSATISQLQFVPFTEEHSALSSHRDPD